MARTTYTVDWPEAVEKHAAAMEERALMALAEKETSPCDPALVIDPEIVRTKDPVEVTLTWRCCGRRIWVRRPVVARMFPEEIENFHESAMRLSAPGPVHDPGLHAPVSDGGHWPECRSYLPTEQPCCCYEPDLSTT